MVFLLCSIFYTFFLFSGRFFGVSKHCETLQNDAENVQNIGEIGGRFLGIFDFQFSVFDFSNLRFERGLDSRLRGNDGEVPAVLGGSGLG